MKENFNKSVALVLKHEGGYVDHPSDPGGATNKGVTLATYRRYIKRNGTKADLKKLTTKQAESVYKKHYWDKIKGDDLPSGIDHAVFDFCVNSGPTRSAKFLQEALDVKVDGKIGPVTIEAAENKQARDVIYTLCRARLAWMRGLNIWPTFGKGWEKRVNRVQSEAYKFAEIQGHDSRDNVIEVDISNLTYVNQNAIRNLPVTKNLEVKIGNSIRAVYGPRYRGEIYSGGQPKKGDPGKRTGSIRHDLGKAADIRVYDPENKLVEGLELARLGQYWLAKGYGSCGLEMKKGGIHIDEWNPPPKGGGLMWTYPYSDAQSWGATARRMLVDGLSGQLPDNLYKPKPQEKPKTSGGSLIVGAIIGLAGLVAGFWEKISTFVQGLIQ